MQLPDDVKFDIRKIIDSAYQSLLTLAKSYQTEDFNVASDIKQQAGVFYDESMDIFN